MSGAPCKWVCVLSNNPELLEVGKDAFVETCSVVMGTAVFLLMFPRRIAKYTRNIPIRSINFFLQIINVCEMFSIEDILLPKSLPCCFKYQN